MAAGFLEQHGQQEAPRIIVRAIPLGMVRDSEDRVLEQPGCVRQSAEAIEPPRRREGNDLPDPRPTTAQLPNFLFEAE